MKKYYIYAIVDDLKNDVIYVGKASNLLNRTSSHLNILGKGFSYRVLSEVVGDNRDALREEQKWIDHFIKEGAQLRNKSHNIAPNKQAMLISFWLNKHRKLIMWGTMCRLLGIDTGNFSLLMLKSTTPKFKKCHLDNIELEIKKYGYDPIKIELEVEGKYLKSSQTKKK